ncbi:MAG: hypothetical protein R3Y32_00285 [Bacillota bacterium]
MGKFKNRKRIVRISLFLLIVMLSTFILPSIQVQASTVTQEHTCSVVGCEDCNEDECIDNHEHCFDTICLDEIQTLIDFGGLEDIQLMAMVTCTACDGGRVDCDDCNGKGWYYCTKSFCYDGERKCYDCDQTGELDCDSCGGDGKNDWVVCETCDGDFVIASKQQICSDCDGKGWYTSSISGENFSCTTCGGNGERMNSATSKAGTGYIEVMGPFLCEDCDAKGGYYTGDGNAYCSLCDDGKLDCPECVNGWYDCRYCVNGKVDCDTCDETGEVDCSVCGGSEEVYVPDSAPTVKFNGYVYKGGTETSPTMIYLNEDCLLSWEINDEGGQVTINDSVVTYSDYNNLNIKSMNFACEDDYTISFEVVTQNKEGVSGSSGGESLYYQVIIDKTIPEIYLSYFVDDEWQDYWQGSNGYDDEAVLIISPNEVFKVTTDDTDATVKMQFYGAEVDYVLGSEIVGVQNTEYLFVITDIAGNQSCVKVMCGYQTPDIYIDGELTEESVLSFNRDVELSWLATKKAHVIVKNLTTGEEILMSGETAGNYILTAEYDSVVSYKITSSDYLGDNIKSCTVTIDKEFPKYNVQQLENNSDYYLSRYFEINGIYYALYENAETAFLEYAMENMVTKAYWNNVDVFAENLADGEVPISGTYYKYYEGNTYICYFSLENLQEMLKELLASEIKTGVFNESKLSSSKIYEDMYNSVVSVDGVEAYLVNSYKFVSVDSVSVVMEYVATGECYELEYKSNINDILTVSGGGLYKITETDDVGNSSVYYIYYDNELSSITAEISNYNGLIQDVILTKAELDSGVFTYESFKITSLEDIDPQAMVRVKSQNGTEWYRLLDEEMPVLIESGEYTISIYDRSGNSMTFTVNIGTVDIDVYFDGESLEYGESQTTPSYHAYNSDVVVSWGDMVDGSVTITNMSTGEIMSQSTLQAGTFDLSADENSEVTYQIVVDNTNKNTKKYYTIKIDKKAPSYNQEQINLKSVYHVSKYFGINGMYYASYENAEAAYIEYAMNSMVVSATWNSVDVFAEILAEGEVVSSGTYYKFYEGKTYTCYFSLENLHGKFKEMFADTVSAEYFNGSLLSSSKMFADMHSKTIEINGVTAYLLSSYTFASSDSSVITVKNIATGEFYDFSYGTNISSVFAVGGNGLYEIIETDDAGNSSKFYVYCDKEISTIEASVSNYSGSTLDVVFSSEELDNGVFYYESFQITSLNDIDPEAMIKVKSQYGTSWYRLLDEEMPVLTLEDTYTITIYDRSGNAISFTVNIGSENVGVTFAKTTSSVTITLNKTLLTSYEDVWIEYNGYEIMYDKNGTAVNAQTLEYSFGGEGGYRVYLLHNGNTYSYYYEFYAGSPTFSYTSGISGNMAVSNVILEYDKDKYILEILKNGESYTYTQSQTDNIATVNIEYKYINNGEYTLILRHKYSTLTDTNYQSTFLMNVILEPFLVGVDNYGTTTESVQVDWYEEMNVEATISINDSDWETYSKGELIEDVGDYTIKVVTESGRIYSFEFSILEKDKPYTITVGSRITSSVPTVHNSTVKFTMVDSDAMIGVIKDGTKLGSYSWGDTLSSDGEYIVSIYCGDDVYHHYFTIDTTAPIGYLVGVTDGGKTQEIVTFGWTEDNVTVRLQHNGGNSETYEYGEEITDSGFYTITMTDKAGNQTVYTFEIDNLVGISVSVENGLISSTAVWVDTWENLTITITKDGEQIDYSSEISDSGFYTLLAADDYGNEFYTEFVVVTNEMQEFTYTLPSDYEWQMMFFDLVYTQLEGNDISLTSDGHYALTYKNTISGEETTLDVYIDTIPPTVETIGFINGGVAEGKASVIWNEENVVASVAKNDKDFVGYAVGEEISDDGSYVITVSDKAGNTTVVTFSKAWKLNTAGKIATGAGGISLAGVACELARRRRIRFK